MKTCGKCIKFDFCKRYVTENESFPEMPKGCPEFKRKPLFKRKQKGVSIMPNKLTDAEVKKALGGAILNAKGYDSKVWSIEVYKLENALDLITRQQAEIERLKNAYKQCAWERDIFAEDMTQEIKKDCSFLMLDIKTIKAEAYKECLKKFEKNIKDVKVTLGQTWEIQNALKKTLNELVGDDNA